MKSIAAFSTVLFAFLFVSSANARSHELVGCVAVNVHDSSYFEESLSVDEYPDILLMEDAAGAKTAMLGSSLYSEKNNDAITLVSTAGLETMYVIDPSHQVEQYLLSVRERAQEHVGELWGRRRADASQQYGEYELIASLSCK